MRCCFAECARTPPLPCRYRRRVRTRSCRRSSRCALPPLPPLPLSRSAELAATPLPFKGQQSGSAESSRSSRRPDPVQCSSETGSVARTTNRRCHNNTDKEGVRCVRLSSLKKKSHVSELEERGVGGCRSASCAAGMYGRGFPRVVATERLDI